VNCCPLYCCDKTDAGIKEISAGMPDLLLILLNTTILNVRIYFNHYLNYFIILKIARKCASDIRKRRKARPDKSIG